MGIKMSEYNNLNKGVSLAEVNKVLGHATPEETINIYKVTTKEKFLVFFAESIKDGKNESVFEIVNMITTIIGGKEIISLFHNDSNARITTNEKNIIQAISKQIDIPWYLQVENKKDNNLVFYCVHIAAWLYQQFSSMDKKTRAVEVVSFIDIIVNDLTTDEWETMLLNVLKENDK